MQAAHRTKVHALIRDVHVHVLLEGEHQHQYPHLCPQAYKAADNQSCLATYVDAADVL